MVRPPQHHPVRRKRRSAISPLDAEHVAELVAKYRLTELEACLQLDLAYSSWQAWKSTNSSRYEHILAHLRGARLKNLCESIDSAGDDCELTVNGKPMTKRGDWRAKAWLAEKITAHDRLSSPSATPETAVNVNIRLMVDTLKRLRMSGNGPSVTVEPLLLSEGNKVAEYSEKCLKSNPTHSVAPATSRIKVPKR